MRFYIPVDQIVDNPYQSVSRDYSDIPHFAKNHIAPMFESRPESLGLQQLPQVRILSSGELADLNRLAPKLASLQPNSIFYDNRELPKNLTIQTIFGHRRIRAVQWLNQNDDRYAHGLIPVEIKQLTDQELLREVFTENYARTNITGIELALLIERAHQVLGPSDKRAPRKAVAEFLGLSGPRISNLHKLLTLPPEIQKANLKGKLNSGQCEALIPIVQIKEHAAGFDWFWGEDPSDYLNEIIIYKDPPARSDIRAFSTRLQERYGIMIHEDMARNKFSSRDIIQPTCIRCPARVNRSCFNHDCFRAKVELAAKQIWQERLPHIKWSEDNQHFDKWTFGEAAKLQTYLEDPQVLQNDKNIVIGCRITGNHARPFAPHEPKLQSMNELSPARALVFGYKNYQLNTKRFETKSNLLKPKIENPRPKRAPVLIHNDQLLEIWRNEEEIFDILDREKNRLLEMLKANLERYLTDPLLKAILCSLIQWPIERSLKITDEEALEKFSQFLVIRKSSPYQQLNELSMWVEVLGQNLSLSADELARILLHTAFTNRNETELYASNIQKWINQVDLENLPKRIRDDFEQWVKLFQDRALY